jgi:hypothetical protein
MRKRYIRPIVGMCILVAMPMEVACTKLGRFSDRDGWAELRKNTDPSLYNIGKHDDMTLLNTFMLPRHRRSVGSYKRPSDPVRCGSNSLEGCATLWGKLHDAETALGGVQRENRLDLDLRSRPVLGYDIGLFMMIVRVFQRQPSLWAGDLFDSIST